MSKPAPALPASDVRADAIARPAPSAGMAGDCVSGEASAQLEAAVAALRTQAVRTMLEEAQAAIRADDWAQGAGLCLKALEIDERAGVAWWMLAICREKAGDAKSAMACYRAALDLQPDQAEVANDLGRLAYGMGELASAEKFFLHFLARFPGHHEAINNLACALRDQERFGAAIEVLKPALRADPAAALLWNTLGSILNEQGDIAEAIVFYDEAVRVDPAFARARYNRGNARLASGDAQGALADLEAAISATQAANDVAMMRLARALALAAAGRVGEAWDAYEARLDPAFAKATRFLVDGERWAPGSALEGRSLLIIGEQGLGDEILFANLLDDVIEAVGPAGRIVLAVEPRQVALFQRSFPAITVGPHATFHVEGQGIVRAAPFSGALGPFDLWTPMASLLRRFRRTHDAFPSRPAFMAADPLRVEHWRRTLASAGDGPKVGVLWKSLKLNAARRRFFSPFEQWRPVIETEGVRIVNLQYGDCATELEAARAEGLEIWSAPGIDLKDDLDEIAALGCALDLVIGPPNATTNIAAACGARVWMIVPPGAWTQLGTPAFPWYPQVRAFKAEALNAWAPVMAEVARALASEL